MPAQTRDHQQKSTTQILAAWCPWQRTALVPKHDNVLCCRGLGWILQAAATRALQRLHDIPELSEALSASTARDLQLDMSPSHSSQLNSSSGAPAAAAALAAAAATAAAVAAAATAAAAPSAHSPLPPAAALSPAQQAPAAAAAAASPGFVAVGSQPEDIQQLAQVLASGNSRWLREKAAAAVEQLAADNPVACRCVLI